MTADAKHPSFEEVEKAVRRDDCTGFCIACGSTQAGVEPDAKRYKCAACGVRAVYGAEQCLLAGLVKEGEDA